jgi:hypothetical protein
MKRDDGNYEYAEDAVDAYFDGRLGEPEMSVWTRVRISGLFGTIEEAEADAVTTARWIRSATLSGENDGH